MLGHDSPTAMASPQLSQAPHEDQHSRLTEFELLDAFTDVLCKERSLQARSLALEILRRYNAMRLEQTLQPHASQSILGGAMWGDAKRVYEIFGVKRGPLDRIRKAGLIESSSLDEGQEEDGSSAVRAKRLYDLISIEKFLRSPEGTNFSRARTASLADKKFNSKEKNKPNLKIMRKK
jgi:hypothetical protein